MLFKQFHILLCVAALSSAFSPLVESAFSNEPSARPNSSARGCFPIPRWDQSLFDDPAQPADITEEEFNRISDEIVALFLPFAEIQNAKIQLNKDWKSAAANAYASRTGDTWHVSVFGGLARLKEMTKDSFALVVCHELGHHFGGFPVKSMGWVSTEGNSDYFATQVCAWLIWGAKRRENAEFASKILEVMIKAVFFIERISNLITGS